MPVWFGYRCYDVESAASYFRRFNDDTALRGLQRNWEFLAVANALLAWCARLDVLSERCPSPLTHAAPVFCPRD